MQKNYAGMSEVSTSDCVALSLKIGPQHQVVYLGDFSGGICDLTHGYSGHNVQYELRGEKGENILRLIANGKTEYHLYGEKSPEKHIGTDGMPYYVSAKLATGQFISLVHVDTPYTSIELRLNSLSV
ncbi:Uncharacterised protein [Serratia fonticola]|uniref:hypothetical protein n=1 Tax=Serratia fonticola TaxID=47917 RepID=UPI00217A812F|nr:hypothetical protein [Serratia fonticola]CAI1933490.1 Uncharacterised protein [Serratia fonticola]